MCIYIFLFSCSQIGFKVRFVHLTCFVAPFEICRRSKSNPFGVNFTWKCAALQDTPMERREGGVSNWETQAEWALETGARFWWGGTGNARWSNQTHRSAELPCRETVVKCNAVTMITLIKVRYRGCEEGSEYPVRQCTLRWLGVGLSIMYYLQPVHTCMNVFICVRMYVCVYTLLYAVGPIYMHAYIYMHNYTYAFRSMYVFTHVCIYMWI